jgi:hypothetical protein
MLSFLNNRLKPLYLLLQFLHLLTVTLLNFFNTFSLLLNFFRQLDLILLSLFQPFDFCLVEFDLCLEIILLAFLAWSAVILLLLGPLFLKLFELSGDIIQLELFLAQLGVHTLVLLAKRLYLSLHDLALLLSLSELISQHFELELLLTAADLVSLIFFLCRADFLD